MAPLPPPPPLDPQLLDTIQMVTPLFLLCYAIFGQLYILQIQYPHFNILFNILFNMYKTKTNKTSILYLG